MPKTSLDIPAITLDQLDELARRDNPGRPNRTATLCRLVASAHRDPAPFFDQRGRPTHARTLAEQEALEARHLPALCDLIEACAAAHGTAAAPGPQITAAQLFELCGPEAGDILALAGYAPIQPLTASTLGRALAPLSGMVVGDRRIVSASVGNRRTWSVAGALAPGTPASAPAVAEVGQ